MRAKRTGGIAAALLSTALGAAPASAYDATDPRNCNGIEWDDKRVLIVQKVTARPRINFIKSPYDDDFKADSCPAATRACRRKSALVTGDLVLAGTTLGAFTCTSYQIKAQRWTRGWLPSAALTPVAPMPSPQVTDWLGTWGHPGGSVEITSGNGGRLHIEGLMVIPVGRDTHNGVIKADVAPQSDTIAFVDDGSMPFETVVEDGCRVRMQRIGPLLLVEDNNNCGGAGVTFSGLYRRNK